MDQSTPILSLTIPLMVEQPWTLVRPWGTFKADCRAEKLAVYGELVVIVHEDKASSEYLERVREWINAAEEDIISW